MLARLKQTYSEGSSERPPQLFFGPFRLDIPARRLWKGDEEVALTPKAVDLLIFLVEREGEVLSRDQILDAIWPNTFIEDHALSVQIREIRKILGDDAKQPVYIETRHRRGYQFISPVDDKAPDEATSRGLVVIEPPRAAVPEVPETRYARSGHVDIAYQVVGEGPVDLIFVMGWVSHLEYFWREPSFARFLRRLASFSRLILFDKRGTGMSDRVPVSKLPTLEERMDDVRAVMEAVGSSHAVLCGVSEGGPMSALFAATYPDKTVGLVMIGTYARRLRDTDYPWGPTLEEREQYLEEIRDHWGGPVGIEERAPSVASDPRFREWWATYLRMGASPGAAVALTRMNAEIDVRRILPTVSCPTLVLHRAGDRCLLAEEGRYMAGLIPGASYVELPGEDHLPFVGQQDQMLDEIERFMSGIVNRASAESMLLTLLFLAFECPEPNDDRERTFLQLARRELVWFRGREADLEHGRPAASFDGPARAIRCARAISDHAVSLGLTIRAAVHAGQCTCVAGVPRSGFALDVGNRLQSMAEPGEVLVTSTVTDLVAGSGLSFASRGTLTLEDSADQWRVFRVLHP